MKQPTMRSLLVILFVLTLVGSARAQIAPDPGQNPAQNYDAAHLDQMLAPIALYPDPLLGQVLVASTYPVQIVEAARWVDDPANAGLQGDNLTAALKQKNWDPSVKSLIAFPQLLQEMNDQIDWAQEVGQAFTAQQADTLNAIQRLRAQAQQAGNLQSDNTEKIVVKDDSILIQPADPHLIPRPVYGPSVYGTWPYPDDQPYSFVTPSVYAVPQPPVIVSTLAIQPYWGSMSYNWHDRRLEWNKTPDRPAVGGVAAPAHEESLHRAREFEPAREETTPATTPTLPQKPDQVAPAGELTPSQREHVQSLRPLKALGQPQTNEVPLVHSHDDQLGAPEKDSTAPTAGATVPLIH